MAGRKNLSGFSLNGTGLLSPGSPLLHSLGHGEWFSSSTLAFEPTSPSPIPCRGRRQTLGPFFLDEVTSLSVLTQLSRQADGCGRVEPGGRADGQAVLAFTEGSALLGLPLVLMRGLVGFLLNFRSQAGVVLWLVVGLRSLKTSTRRMNS